MNRNETEIEINLLDLIKHLRKKVWIILAVAALFALAGMIFSTLFITPQYTASTRMYVLNRTNENTVVSADFQISNYMVNDYKELIKGRNVTHEVIQKLGLQMSDGALAGKIAVSAPQDTRILQIDVTDTDPVRAQQIANAVRETTSEQLKDIMQVDSVTTIYEANVPRSPSSPNVMSNTVWAGMIGFALIVVIYAIIFVVDDRIRTEDDVERYLGVSILGVIPDNESLPSTGALKTRKRIIPDARVRGKKQWK